MVFLVSVVRLYDSPALPLYAIKIKQKRRPILRLVIGYL
jgi:hypothetical protein